MSLFVKQDETRSQLQQQIAAELQEKARKRAEEADLPDHVEDSHYIEKTEYTGRHGWIWIVVIAAVIIAAIITIVMSHK